MAKTNRFSNKKREKIVDLDVFEVYNRVTTGVFLRFPNNYMDKNIAKILVRSIIIDKLHFTRKDICEKFNFEILKKYHLGGTSKYFDSIFDGVDYMFNDLYLDNPIMEWELHKVYPKFWEDIQNRIRYINWVAEKENIDIFDIKEAKKITAVIISKKYRGSKAMKAAGGLHRLIMDVPGVKYKEWQFIKISNWTEEKVIIATRWLVEEVLQWNHEKVANDISAKIFYDNNLRGMLSNFCENSPAKALKIAYPGAYTNEELLKGLYKRRINTRMQKKYKRDIEK
ncbi:MAG: hypothetical protein RR290_04065 [Clostridia bacterium]